MNLAARLESSVAKAGQIVVSDVTSSVSEDIFATRHCGDYQPNGISRQVTYFELLGRKAYPPRARTALSG